MSSNWGNMETLEEMAATIAHEIKNPLALALANLDLIKVSDTGEKYKKHCSIIEQELYKINQLVLDLIHITLSDECEQMIDLTAMLDELVLEYQLRYETITFTSKHESSSNFFGHPKKIRMVFTNLLNNAVEAISENGIIEIVLENSPNSIKITINDNGIGLPKALLLEPHEFYTTKVNGTGVGLYYCRAIIAKHGGRLKLQNRPEGGCSVIIELPVKGI